MRLIDLKPKWEMHGEYTHLAFDCPVCKTHRIEIPVGDHPKAWGMTGDSFQDLTITPSIAHKTHYADSMDEQPRLCESHFFITNGEIRIV